MPYIPQRERDVLDPDIDRLARCIATRGQLTYAVYRLVLPGTSYDMLSTARAVLRDVLDVISAQYLQYETRKERENGRIL